MAYGLRYHPRVADRDLRKITPEMRRRIARAIETKLATSPERVGVPLSGTLSGFWKLRAGDHRVVYKIRPREIWILAIVHRKDNQDAERRASGGQD